MYVCTPIRQDLLQTAKQTSCLKGKWYVRRFDPDTVQNGHTCIYSTMKEERVFISSFSVGYAEDFSYGRDEP